MSVFCRQKAKRNHCKRDTTLAQLAQFQTLKFKQPFAWQSSCGDCSRSIPGRPLCNPRYCLSSASHLMSAISESFKPGLSKQNINGCYAIQREKEQPLSYCDQQGTEQFCNVIHSSLPRTFLWTTPRVLTASCAKTSTVGEEEFSFRAQRKAINWQEHLCKTDTRSVMDVEWRYDGNLIGEREEWTCRKGPWHIFQLLLQGLHMIDVHMSVSQHVN